MFFQQRSSSDGTQSYFYGCGGKGFAVAVDVLAGDEGWYLDQAMQKGVRISYVIDTHIHADHLSGGRQLAQQAGARYGLHESDVDLVSYSIYPLRDGEVLETGNVQTQILHTPGHTRDSICLLVTDLRRGPEPWFLLTGDTLFVGAVGRPDLGGTPEEMATLLYASLQAKILPLPDTLEIYPGHSAGSVCGAGLSGKGSSTLAFEKRWDPYLQMDEASFVRELVASTPARPAQMAQIVAANMGRAA
ncbi:MBL fold metallo-hydrolase [Acidithiobacillus acidisediminis]|uniref:MBL fold metallo-hydrolase n=1 Tax=Acidithiobacillus TaxID=119977 RepID=UPI00200EA7A2|nr:MBL fold metallo-hydrolase [Acidithiobacillus sp. S30A2]